MKTWEEMLRTCDFCWKAFDTLKELDKHTKDCPKRLEAVRKGLCT